MGSLMVEKPLGATSLQLQRILANRSPTESPPIAKKFFRPNSTQSQCGWSLLAQTDNSDTACAENRSILKRVNCTRSRTWHAGQSARKVNFHDNVSVMVYDRLDGENVTWQSQQLNTEPRDRRAFIGRVLASRLHSSQTTSSSSVAQDVTAAQSLPRQQSTSPRSTSADKSLDNAAKQGSTVPARPLPSVMAPVVDDSALTSIKFTFHEDNSGQLWLRFSVALGSGVAAGDALVKANVAGNKVRVIGTRTVKRDSASPGREEFTQRYTLPMDVDPYAISARMDSAGNLYVQAPVMTGERHYRTRAATH